MVDTVREPLIVLDKDLRVIAASRSFYVKFATNPDDSQGQGRGCQLRNGRRSEDGEEQGSERRFGMTRVGTNT
jgi:hypothetical protein